MSECFTRVHCDAETATVAESEHSIIHSTREVFSEEIIRKYRFIIVIIFVTDDLCYAICLFEFELASRSTSKSKKI